MVSVNILTFLISPPHLVSSHPTLISDGLWMAQVDAIVSFESKLAPFLGAAHLTTPTPKLSPKIVPRRVRKISCACASVCRESSMHNSNR